MRKITTIVLCGLASTGFALATGTKASTIIKNSATLEYSAGGVTQPTIESNEDSFVVDKKIDMILVTTDTEQTQVTPGQEDRITNYEFKNEGNADQKFKFTVDNLDNGQEADYNELADNDNVKNLEIQCNYTNENGDDKTTDWASEFIIKIKQDTTATCQVRADINDPDDTPDTNDEGYGDDEDVMNVELQAVAYKEDESGPEEETTAEDTQGSVDVVFADGVDAVYSTQSGLGDGSSKNGKGDTPRDGKEVARSGYIIHTPVLSVQKTSCVIKDPVNDTNNPKRIPGAIIRYMFDITNNGSADVNDLNITDTLNDNLYLGDTKDSARKDENQTSCSCTTKPATDISDDTTIDNQDLKITHINVAKDGNHTCVSIEVEIE
jgi:uncharacterized repeat protein (TIGR01451 family)